MRIPRHGSVPPVPLLALTLLLIGAAAMAANPDLGWQDSHDGGPGLPDQGVALLVDPQGDILTAGESTDWDGAADLHVRKLSRADGRQLWEMAWGDPGGNDMAMIEIAFDPLGDVIVGGYIRGCVG